MDEPSAAWLTHLLEAARCASAKLEGDRRQALLKADLDEYIESLEARLAESEKASDQSGVRY
jgi:hypothetical protein